MKRLFGYLRDYRKESILGPLLKLCEALLELFVPLVVAAIVDTGIQNKDTSYVVWMSLLLVALGLVGLAFSITAQYFAARASVGFVARLRHALLSHMTRLSYTEIDALGGSTMITRMTSDMNQVQTGLNLTLRLLLRSPFVVFGAMVMAYFVEPQAALVFAVAIPVLSIVVFGIMLLCMPLYKRVQARLDGVLRQVRENLGGARVIRAFGREEAEGEIFAEKNDGLTVVQRRVGRISALLNPLTFVLINAAVIWLMYIGALKVEHGLLTQGAVIALYNYMSQILVELIKLADLIITMTKSLACGKRIAAVLEIAPEPVIGNDLPVLEEGEAAVRLQDASLIYRGAAGEAVSGVSFTAMPGETVGIIGGTGSGKSSLVSLIYRAYPASAGRVEIYGQDVSTYSLDALRNEIGLVPQKPQLFRGSIRDNLRVGKKDATDEEMWEALEQACAADFVKEKEGGLGYLLEANGRNLSGGQRQRLTIARALVRCPRILILDDSSSALDYATDAALRANLKKLPYRPTTLIVTQRTASIMQADQILVLDEGRVVGRGKHGDLLESCAVYREIYDSQYKKEDVTNG